MDQTRKRRLSSRRAAGHQSKVSRGEETDGLPSSDMRDEESAASHRVKIRASSPSDCSQERHATCLKISEDDAEKTLIITCDKDQGGIRPLGRRKGLRRKRETAGDVGHQQKVCEDDIQPEVEIDRELDRELENKSRQHNLTSANVRSIIHEVITNEHVVAMMKAAINETEPIPVFEPKMTRSKLKEVVEKGVVIPNWNISPIKKPTEVKKGPQFVDIPLEEEDSSDEEYRPDEDDEDETAEETLLESDLESAASSPRGSRVSLHRSHSEHEEERTSNSRPGLRRSRHLTVAVTPMGPPPPPAPSRAPPECSFLEKLHAVDEELAFGPDCMESYQTLSSANGEESLISFRTRSKRPLRDVPLGRLEAELRAPDITPDMYEFGSAPEDREWTQWLQGLMTSEMDNEEEGDDEDDPEYNFLADIDEPDVEDYRNDKAVRITKKEVNDLMEELFDAFQDELCGQDEEGHEEEEDKEEEESTPQEPAGTLENIPYEDPLTDVLKQQYRTVREQLAALRKRKALLESKGVSVPPSCPQRPSSSITPMILSSAQKLQLQQQIQQHVQLLTQVTMLSSSVKGLEPEASTSKQFLLELQMFAQQTRGPTEPGFTSIFRVCNLEGSLSLLEELDQLPKCDSAVPSLCFPGSQFPAHLAWLMVTRPVFLYPELLPEVQLRPCRFKGPFTSAEDCLVVLGHKHFRGTLHPLQMTCRYLLAARRFVRLKSHIRSTCHKPFPSVIKTYFVGGKCPPMPLACKRVSPCDQRPPVERDKSLMPDWLSKNIKLIYEHVKKYNQPSDNSESQATNPPENTQAEETIESGSPEPHYSFPPDTRYSPTLPEDLAQAIKPPDPCKKKKPSKLSESSKPALSAEKLEEVLSHLPTLLPKAPTMTGPLLCHPPVPQSQSLELQTISLRPELNPFTSVNEAMNSHKERPIIVSQVSKAPPVGQNLRGIVTLPTASVTTDLSSSSVRTAAVKNTVETPMGISGAPKIAQVGATQGNVIITLPTAAMAPVKSIPSGHVTVNQTGQMVSSNIATAVPAGSTQGGLIITFPPPPVSNTFICPTPIINTTSASTSLAKDHISQRCGTLLRLSTIPRDSSGLASPKPQFPSQKPLHRFLLLPPGCVFTSNSLGHQIAEPGQTLKHLTVLNSTQVELSRQETPETNNSVYKCVQEPAEEEELHDDGGNENEVDECVEKDSRDLFLTLSESSGSPAPSIGQDPDTDKEVMGNEEQGAKVKSRLQTEINQLAGANSVSEDLSGPELQQTIEKFSHLDTKTPSVMEENSDDGIHHPSTEEMGVKTPFVFNNDTLDEDPHRDAKDVAFAQAYLEKVYEVLQVAPGKVEEFLRVLSEFEKDPESRTSLELFRRLKPVLTDWPELLQDFAAFLHPDQARECGLLAEQQAFERSRRFLRQLELTLGEQSVLYRQVVHILQGGLAGSKEIKAQITLLLCDHADLLEEFWVFFKQLYPHVQWHSDEDEDNAENVSIVEAIQEIEESQSCPPIRSLTPAEKMKPLKSAIKHRRKRDKNNKMAELRKHNSRRNTVATQLENDVDSSSSVDSQQSSFKPAGTSVCAKNISCMPNGKKVVLWTREADRVILTTCQQRGAKPATFHAIATQLGNKTANEVLERFQDLIKLFRKSSKLCHTSQSDTEEQSSIIEDEPD